MDAMPLRYGFHFTGSKSELSSEPAASSEPYSTLMIFSTIHANGIACLVTDMLHLNRQNHKLTSIRADLIRAKEASPEIIRQCSSEAARASVTKRNSFRFVPSFQGATLPHDDPCKC